MRPEQEIEAVFSLLKTHLKSKKLSYRKIAQRLKMSESNLKRIFSTRSCGLQQIAKICAAAEIPFFDLIKTAATNEVPIYQLSREAEEFFAQNLDHFIFFRNLSAASDPDIFIRNSGVTKLKLNSYLTSLEKLKLLKSSRTGVKLEHSGYLNFSSKSPLLKRLTEKWVPWFFQRVVHNQERNGYTLKLMSTGLTREHRAQLIEELGQLLERYILLGATDQSIGSRDFESVGICIGVGPHRIGFFEEDPEIFLPVASFRR